MLELAIAVVVVAILTVSALPNREADDQAKLDSAANRLESDIEYARSVSVASPSDPAVLKVSQTENRYWISKYSAPDTPITNPSTRKPYVVQLGRGGDASMRNVSISADNLGDQRMLIFNSNGSIKADGNLGVEFQLGTKKTSLKVAPNSASTQIVNGDLASIGLTNITSDAVSASDDDGGAEDTGLIGGLLDGLGL